MDAEGQPRISWRVLILQELGYAELYNLFRLDQPWNSPHNRQLIELMPSCYAVDAQGDANGKTPLLTVTSPRAVLVTQHGNALNRFQQELGTGKFVQAVFQVEV